VSDLKFQAAGVLGTGLLGALFATTRVERVHPNYYRDLQESGQNFIFVLWHGQLLPLTHYHRHEGVVVLVSEHADGEYITRVLEHNGYDTVRGSSTRGATRSLKALIRAARAGRTLAVTPDGPQGPPQVMKPGAVAVAQATGLPMVPVAVGSSSGWRFRSWDRFLVPKPLARITIEYGAPVRVDRHASRDGLEAVRRSVQETLNEMTARLNPELDPPDPPDPAPGGADPAEGPSEGSWEPPEGADTPGDPA